MSQSIDVFSQCRRLAVVGVSRARRKYGNYAYRELKARGFDVMAVHPTLASVEGDPCSKSLAELPRPADGVWVCVRPDQAPEILRQAAAAGIRRAWLQQGAESEVAAKVAAELGIESERVYEMLKISQQPVSLEMPAGQDGLAAPTARR